MKKINLKDYKVPALTPTGEKKDVNYEVKESIAHLLFEKELNLNYVQLLKQDDLARKILAAEDSVILEDEEYSRVEQAIKVVKGLGRNEVELIRRITEAETVQVAEKPKATATAEAPKA